MAWVRFHEKHCIRTKKSNVHNNAVKADKVQYTNNNKSESGQRNQQRMRHYKSGRIPTSGAIFILNQHLLLYILLIIPLTKVELLPPRILSSTVHTLSNLQHNIQHEDHRIDGRIDDHWVPSASRQTRCHGELLRMQPRYLSHHDAYHPTSI